jgi:hypothetical protein
MGFEEIKPAEHVMASVSSTINLGRPVSDYVGPRRFSYSASGTLQACQRKYYLKYVLNLPKDPDVTEDYKALVVGKVYHYMLETSRHQRRDYSVQELAKIVKECDLEPEEIHRINAYVLAYFTLREGSGLICIACEVEVGDTNFVGYVDFILMDKNGRWWIADLKTSGMPLADTIARLAQDPQLNLYSFFVPQIAAKLKLRKEDFAGAVYSAVSKTRIAVKVNESLAAYAARVGVICTEVDIPKELLQPQAEMDKLLRLKAVSDGMKEIMDIEKTECNRGSCVNYNKLCEYFSHCHAGHTATEAKELAKTYTNKNSTDRTLPAVATDSLDLLF